MINFTCPTCKKMFSVPDDYAGKSASCKGCGGKIVVPHPAAKETDLELTPVEPSMPPSSGVGQNVSSGVAGNSAKAAKTSLTAKIADRLRRSGRFKLANFVVRRGRAVLIGMLVFIVVMAVGIPIFLNMRAKAKYDRYVKILEPLSGALMKMKADASVGMSYTRYVENMQTLALAYEKAEQSLMEEEGLDSKITSLMYESENRPLTKDEIRDLKEIMSRSDRYDLRLSWKFYKIAFKAFSLGLENFKQDGGEDRNYKACLAVGLTAFEEGDRFLKMRDIVPLHQCPLCQGRCWTYMHGKEWRIFPGNPSLLLTDNNPRCPLCNSTPGYTGPPYSGKIGNQYSKNELKGTSAAENLGAIAEGVLLYKEKHYAPPASLGLLVSDKYISPQCLVSPSGKTSPPKVDMATGNITGDLDFVYFEILSGIPDEIVRAYEKPEINNNEGTNVLLADGTVKWVDMAAFNKMMEMSKRYHEDGSGKGHSYQRQKEADQEAVKKERMSLLSRIKDIEEQAGDLIAARKYAEGIEKYQDAMTALKNGTLQDEEASAIFKRLSGSKQKAQEDYATFEKQRAEQAAVRLAEKQYSEYLDKIKPFLDSLTKLKVQVESGITQDQLSQSVKSLDSQLDSIKGKLSESEKGRLSWVLAIRAYAMYKASSMTWDKQDEYARADNENTRKLSIYFARERAVYNLGAANAIQEAMACVNNRDSCAVHNCPLCEGTGKKGCPICQGTGKCPYPDCNNGAIKCACAAYGLTPSNNCTQCRGKGVISCPACSGSGKCPIYGDRKDMPCPLCGGAMKVGAEPGKIGNQPAK